MIPSLSACVWRAVYEYRRKRLQLQSPQKAGVRGSGLGEGAICTFAM